MGQQARAACLLSSRRCRQAPVPARPAEGPSRSAGPPASARPDPETTMQSAAPARSAGTGPPPAQAMGSPCSGGRWAEERLSRPGAGSARRVRKPQRAPATELARQGKSALPSTPPRPPDPGSDICCMIAVDCRQVDAIALQVVFHASLHSPSRPPANA